MQRMQASSNERVDKQVKLSSDYEKSVSDLKRLQMEKVEMVKKMEELGHQKESMELQLGDLKVLTTQLQKNLEDEKSRNGPESSRSHPHVSENDLSKACPSNEDEQSSGYPEVLVADRESTSDVSELLEIKMSRLNALTDRLLKSNAFALHDS